VAAAKKLVLCVIDALAPQMLERTVAAGGAPVLAELMANGTYVPDCVAAFPSVTPVCAASIVTGVGPDRHQIPAMNWYHRGEERYIEYGSSFRAAQRVGIAKQLTDTVYNMNRAHLSHEVLTLFERLDDASVRTAGTTYLMYRGRHEHEPQRDTALTRLASTFIRHPVMGPLELFYADIFASRRTPCRSGLGMPGVRDRHSGCVGAFLVENDLFDFMLLSLPDNDWHSHRYGVDAQEASIAHADTQLQRMMDASGGVNAFLADHAMIVLADHSQAPITVAVALQDALAPLGVLDPSPRRSPSQSAIALCPSQRSAMAYVLDPDLRASAVPAIVDASLALDPVDLAMWLVDDAHPAPAEGVIASAAHDQLRFAPGDQVRDPRGAGWNLEGNLLTIDAHLRDGVLHTPTYPDVLARAWSALTCPTSGDVLLSAAPGAEFSDWGGQAHVGGGSHGSLRAEDSLGALLFCGVDPEPSSPPRGCWAIRDVAPIVLQHFGLPT
jgi:hypothetical protein